jgi:4-aminobutyrate aminotransferase
MFAVEHFDVTPDILIMAKGLASGYPLSAIASRKELTDKQPAGSMGGTYTGNAVACAAAEATLRVFEEEDLLAQATRLGGVMRSRLNQMQSARPGMCVWWGWVLIVRVCIYVCAYV